jgi:hypothetical protein
MGEGTGSATPLAWSMAQFIRLAHGIEAGEPVETPSVVAERYLDGPRPAGPTLRVETRVVDNALQVTGETDGALVAAKTTSEATLASVTEDGRFELEVPVERGDTPLVVAAATDTDLATAGTTVERRWV